LRHRFEMRFRHMEGNYYFFIEKLKLNQKAAMVKLPSNEEN